MGILNDIHAGLAFWAKKRWGDIKNSTRDIASETADRIATYFETIKIPLHDIREIKSNCVMLDNDGFSEYYISNYPEAHDRYEEAKNNGILKAFYYNMGIGAKISDANNAAPKIDQVYIQALARLKATATNSDLNRIKWFEELYDMGTLN